MHQGSKVSLGVYLVILAGIIAMSFGGYYYWKTQQIILEQKSAQIQIEEKERRLSDLQPTAIELNSYNTLAKELHNLFDNQVDWNVGFFNIEQRLYKKMVITSLQVTSQNILTFSGSTTDYGEYAKIYASLTDSTAKKYFSKTKPVSLGKIESKEGQSATTKDGSVTFTFSLTMVPSILKPVAPILPIVPNL
jgi:hypothetical protein